MVSVSGSTYAIRKASLADLDLVVAIVSRAVPLMNSQGNFQWTESYPLRDDFEKDVSRGLMWVAESSDGTVVGAASITFDQSPEYTDLGWDINERCVVPHRMVVDPLCRKSGIAQSFMRKAEEIAVAEGCAYVRVDTNERNVPMQRLFTKLGYDFAGKFSFKARPPEKFGMWLAFSRSVPVPEATDAQFIVKKAALSDVTGIMNIVHAAVQIMNAEGNYQWNHTYPLQADFERDVKSGVLWIAAAKGAVDDFTVKGAVAITFDQSPEYTDLGWDINERCVVPHRMVVDPLCRKSGIAQSFMRKAEEIAVTEGCAYVRVDTNERNVPMQRLFTKLGYERASGSFTFKDLPPEIYGDMHFYGFSKSLNTA